MNKALFFWSKKASSSLYFKSIIIQHKLDIDIISVDNSKVRDLISNSKYPIKNIPSLLVITGNSNDFRLYSGENLKIWFDKFFETISQYSDKSNTQNETQSNESTYNNLSNPIKPVMNRQQLSQNYRTGLSSPGIEFNGNTSLTLIPEPQENNDSKFIMTNRGIGKPPKQQKNDNDEESYEDENETLESLRPSKLKNNSISAAELADQLKAQREELEQELEENRPFD